MEGQMCLSAQQATFCLFLLIFYSCDHLSLSFLSCLSLLFLFHLSLSILYLLSPSPSLLLSLPISLSFYLFKGGSFNHNCYPPFSVSSDKFRNLHSTVKQQQDKQKSCLFRLKTHFAICL